MKTKVSKEEHSHHQSPRRETKRGPELIFKIIIQENFPNRKKLNLHNERAHWAPKKINPKPSAPNQIPVRSGDFKNKDTILKVSRDKDQLTLK